MASSSALDGPTGGYRNAPTSAPVTDPTSGDLPPGWSPPAGGVLSLEPRELAGAVAKFHEAAAAASRAASGAPRAGAGTGYGVDPWGSDPLGAAFGGRYAEPAQHLPVALEALSQLLDGTADQLARTGRAFAETDEHAAGEVRKLMRSDARD
ncbi:hypothetical protein [Amycolatopsis samaneae]|uniref:Excreted virulence factor EspC, type VII ESX diderm n=1 Tax=Amycolatopsis samaneae TaxID=664691 RepID=A0ABW5GL70_9PSEU